MITRAGIDEVDSIVVDNSMYIFAAQQFCYW